jgi:hypothetical protein
VTHEDCRELGPEMTADGWRVISGDTMLWCCERARQCVLIEGPWKRSSWWAACPIAPGEQLAPDDDCYCVSRYAANDMGEPIPGHYDGFLTASYGKALLSARATREAILATLLPAQPTKQMTFDDLLEAKP